MKEKASLPAFLGLDGDDVLFSTEYMARKLKIEPRSLRRWVKTRQCPQRRRGFFEPFEVMAWRGQADTGAGPESLEIRTRSAMADFREVRTERERLLKEILEGKYLRAEDVENEWAARVTEVRAGLMALVNKLAGEFSEPEARGIVQKVATEDVRDLLDQYARTGTYTPSPRRGKVARR